MREDILGLEIDDDFDIAPPRFERLAPALEGNATGNQALEPGPVCARERFGGDLIMSAICVDGAEDYGVVEHQVAIDRADIQLENLARLGDASQADNTGGRGRVETIADQRRSAGAFHQYVRRKPAQALRVAVV